MSNEETKTNSEGCLCQNKCFRKFLLTILATFIGAYCALSLFTAIHKPCPFHPPIIMPPAQYQMEQQIPPNFHKQHQKMFDEKMKKDIQILKEVAPTPER